MPRPVGINHVAVEVGDVDEALAFLGRIFDLQLRGRSRGMAFVDMGDQFIALAATSQGQSLGHGPGGHIGLVVDDREATLAAAREAGAQVTGNDVLDPWGNRWQIVDYRDVQFTKAPRILEGMGLDALPKAERALEELRAKGLAD